ncbi:ABC transporter permease [Halorubellus salinus]|uniref:ABC transporter permease n=1 Tax=Halorubellus salinus TaxID=755309 RepID=UPI001D08466B|nr:ABC transporter permease [Halorubellus salinus]
MTDDQSDAGGKDGADDQSAAGSEAAADAATTEVDDGDIPSWSESAASKIVTASAKERVFISVAAFLASVLVGSVLVYLSGLVVDCTSAGFLGSCYNPFLVYYFLFVDPFIGGFNVALVMKETVLLLFTGLSVAVAFRAGLFNIGSQGQLVLGGLATALALIFVAPLAPGGVLGTLVLVPFALLVGAVFGGLYAAIPGALKAYAEANEVITTIMLNFVATNLAFFLISTYYQDPESGSVQTVAIPEAARLKPIVPFFEGAQFSVLALLLGVGLVAGTFYVLANTAFGYDVRTSGLQAAAADYAGVDPKRLVVSSMTLSGALAGVGGAVYVMMVMARYRTGVPALGFDGITVSILAGNNPLGVIPAALLFGVMKAGSLSIDFSLGVPKQLVGVLRGLVILFVAMPEFFRLLARYTPYGPDADRAVATDGGDDDA